MLNSRNVKFLLSVEVVVYIDEDVDVLGVVDLGDLVFSSFLCGVGDGDVVEGGVGWGEGCECFESFFGDWEFWLLVFFGLRF